MGLGESLKKMLGMVCAYCESKDIKFHCGSCHKNYCKNCIEFANKVVRKELESIKTASILQNKGSVTTYVVKLLDDISGKGGAGYCPTCSISRMNHLIRGKQLSNLAELNPPCQFLIR